MNVYLPPISGNGYPQMPDISNRYIEQASCILRQDNTDRTRWNFIVIDHFKDLVLGDYATAVGSTITITLSKTILAVIGAYPSPDEYLSSNYGFRVGASTSSNTIDLNASMFFGGVFVPNVLLDGSAGTGALYNFNLGNIFLFAQYVVTP